MRQKCIGMQQSGQEAVSSMHAKEKRTPTNFFISFRSLNHLSAWCALQIKFSCMSPSSAGTPCQSTALALCGRRQGLNHLNCIGCHEQKKNTHSPQENGPNWYFLTCTSDCSNAKAASSMRKRFRTRFQY